MNHLAKSLRYLLLALLCAFGVSGRIVAIPMVSAQQGIAVGGEGFFPDVDSGGLQPRVVDRSTVAGHPVVNHGVLNTASRREQAATRDGQRVGMSSEDMMWDDMYLAAVESDLLRLKEEMNGFLAYAQVVNSSGDTAKSQTLNRMLGLADGWIGYPVHVAGMPHSTGAQAIEDDYLAFSYEVAALGTQWYVVVNSPSEAEFQNAFKTFCNMHDRVTAQGDDLFFTVSAAISVNLDGRDRSTVGRPVDGYRPVDVLLPRERPVLFSD